MVCKPFYNLGVPHCTNGGLTQNGRFPHRTCLFFHSWQRSSISLNLCRSNIIRQFKTLLGFGFRDENSNRNWIYHQFINTYEATNTQKCATSPESPATCSLHVPRKTKIFLLATVTCSPARLDATARLCPLELLRFETTLFCFKHLLAFRAGPVLWRNGNAQPPYVACVSSCTGLQKNILLCILHISRYLYLYKYILVYMICKNTFVIMDDVLISAKKSWRRTTIRSAVWFYSPSRTLISCRSLMRWYPAVEDHHKLWLAMMVIDYRSIIWLRIYSNKQDIFGYC